MKIVKSKFVLLVVVGACVLAVVLLALFTREPAGRFRHHDRALVSKRSCNLLAA